MGLFSAILLPCKRICLGSVCASLRDAYQDQMATQKLCWAPRGVQKQDPVR